MTNQHYIGWVRDSAGRVLSRSTKQIANAVTTMCGGCIPDADGLANTTPHVVVVFE